MYHVLSQVKAALQQIEAFHAATAKDTCSVAVLADHVMQTYGHLAGILALHGPDRTQVELSQHPLTDKDPALLMRIAIHLGKDLEQKPDLSKTVEDDPMEYQMLREIISDSLALMGGDHTADEKQKLAHDLYNNCEALMMRRGGSRYFHATKVANPMDNGDGLLDIWLMFIVENFNETRRFQ